MFKGTGVLRPELCAVVCGETDTNTRALLRTALDMTAEYVVTA
jgi:hypothetical protein